MGFKLISPEAKVPQIVLDSYAELYDLCENHNRNGVLNPKDVCVCV